MGAVGREEEKVELWKQLGGKRRVIVVARFPKTRKRKEKEKVNFGEARGWQQPCPVRDTLEFVDHGPLTSP